MLLFNTLSYNNGKSGETILWQNSNFNKRASMRIMKLLMSYCLDMKAKLLKSSALFA